MPQEAPRRSQDADSYVFSRAGEAPGRRSHVFLRVREAQGEPRRPTHTCFYVFSLRVAAAQGWSRRPIHTCFTVFSLRVARIIRVFTCRR